jgi:hypothetical protein
MLRSDVQSLKLKAGRQVIEVGNAKRFAVDKGELHNSEIVEPAFQKRRFVSDYNDDWTTIVVAPTGQLHGRLMGNPTASLRTRTNFGTESAQSAMPAKPDGTKRPARNARLWNLQTTSLTSPDWHCPRLPPTLSPISQSAGTAEILNSLPRANACVPRLFLLPSRPSRPTMAVLL